MFNPNSIAVLGRDRQDDAPAALLVRNLIDAGFRGPVLPVNPHRHAVSGVLAYRNVANLPEPPELAILATPLAESPALIDELGAKGSRAILLIGDESSAADQADAALRARALAIAKAHRIRLLGPDRFGMAIPAYRINAALGRTPPISGPVSVVTQSSTMMRAIIHWGHARNIGFSHLISLGDRWDVEASDLLDYLARDARTRAVLLYLESVPNPRRFLSAARAAARVKPVIALKPPGASDTDEAIFDAAIRRVGMLRVDTMDHWFGAVKALTFGRPDREDRLFVLGNSHSIGLMAGTMLGGAGGRLATIGPATRDELAQVVPGHTIGNPLDLGNRAGFREYDRALEALLRESEVGGLLIVHVPVSPDSDGEVARAIIARTTGSHRPVTVSWVGATASSPVWQSFQDAGIPTYRTPEEAVWSCLQLAEYARNQSLLIETPSSVPETFAPDPATAHRVIAAALATGQDPLNIQATRELLTAYRIPLIDTRFAATPAAAARLATEIGGRVALKIFSSQIANRADIGGVALGLEGPQEVLEAAAAMLRRVQTLLPDAAIEGFAVQPMLSRQGAYEIAIGVRTGRDFKAGGPVLYFGHGGTEIGVIDDLAFALPPLNMHLARELMARTRIYAKLRDNPGRPVDLDALAMTLIKVSQMVVDLGELVELDINPLWVGRAGVLALNARARVAPASGPATERLAIHPYPKELEQTVEMPDGRSLLLRPILPEDEPALQAMVGRMPPEDVRWRFFQSFKELPRDMAARLTQLDYDREMRLVLAGPGVAGEAALWGVADISADPDLEEAEFAIALDRRLTGQGLGSFLMRQIIAYARQRGIREIFGDVMDDNEPMLRLGRMLGFAAEPYPGDPHLVRIRLALSPERASPP